MVIPSVTSILLNVLELPPEDASYMPMIMEDAYIIRYRVDAFLASMTIVYFDHAISLDVEIERIWLPKTPWRLPEYLFLINRYIVPAMLTFDAFVYAQHNLSAQFCEFFERWQMWPNLLSLATIELVLVLRVSALFWNTKIVTYILAVLFACEFITLSSVVITVYKSTIRVVPSYGILPGCIAIISHWDVLYGLSLGPLLFESIILLLTLYRVFSLIMQKRAYLNKTLWLITRDSTWYFALGFVVLLANVIAMRVIRTALGTVCLGPSNAIACVATGRLILNLRNHSPLEETDSPRLDSPFISTTSE